MRRAVYNSGHPPAVADFIDIEGATAASVAASTTAANSAALVDGLYDVWCDADCYIATGADPAATLTAANGYLVRTGTTVPVYVNNAKKLGVILASGTGTFKLHQVG